VARVGVWDLGWPRGGGVGEGKGGGGGGRGGNRLLGLLSNTCQFTAVFLNLCETATR